MPSASRSGISTGGRVRCSATIGTSSANAAPSSTGHLVVLPRVQVDDVPDGEQLGDADGEDAEVGAGVLGRLRAGVARDPQHLADLELAVLGELAEQPHRPVLEVGERAVGGARAPEPVEPLERVLGQVDRGQPGDQPGVGELGDLGRQQGAGRVARSARTSPCPASRRSPAPNPAMLVDSARSAEAAMNSGRP